jgi:hypothetical protein
VHLEAADIESTNGDRPEVKQREIAEQRHALIRLDLRP